jgi:hypothetical protein
MPFDYVRTGAEFRSPWPDRRLPAVGAEGGADFLLRTT